MSFNQEVDQVWTHEPLDLGLDVDGSDVWQCFGLSTCVSEVYRLILSYKAPDLHDLHMPQMVIPIFKAC